MRRVLALIAIWGFLLSFTVTAWADGNRVGELQEINLQKGVIKVDNAEFLLNGHTLEGIAIGDQVRVVYTQADDHDVPAVRTIVKVPGRR